MPHAAARLHLLKQAEETSGTDHALVAIAGIGADDGRLAHRATHPTNAQHQPHSRHAAESELLGFVCDLVDAPPSALGQVTRGVTETALLVIRAARDRRVGLTHPSMVLPESAHPAYFAAAESLGITPIIIPIDGEGRALVGAMVGAIRDDTVLVIASAPSYTHGVIDPIAWIGAATTTKQVPLHVDATAGGWSLAYGVRAGRVTAPWGFAVGGVTSLALDVGPDHGTAAEFTVLLHRDSTSHDALHEPPRPRGPLEIAATWTPASRLLADAVETVHEVGHHGWSKLALDAFQAVAALVAGLMEIPSLRLLAYPDATVITLRTDTTCDPMTLADELHRRGWSAQPVLLEVGSPLLRFPVTAAMLPCLSECLTAFVEAVDDAQSHGCAQVDATLDRLLATVDPHDVSDYATTLLLDAAAVLDADPDRPGRRAATNLLLSAAEPGIREVLVALHHARLTRPSRPRLLRPGGVQPVTSASTEASE